MLIKERDPLHNKANLIQGWERFWNQVGLSHQHRRDQRGDRSNRPEANQFSVPAAEAASAGVQLPGHVPPLRCSAGRQGCIILFQIQLDVSDHPWNAHIEVQKINVWQHYTESSALSCSPKAGSGTAAPFLMVSWHQIPQTSETPILLYPLFPAFHHPYP